MIEFSSFEIGLIYQTEKKTVDAFVATGMISHSYKPRSVKKVNLKRGLLLNGWAKDVLTEMSVLRSQINLTLLRGGSLIQIQRKNSAFMLH